MRPFSRIAFLAFLSVLSFAFIGGCKSLDETLSAAPKPTARIIGAELRHLNLQTADLLFTVEVSNPYVVGLPLLDLSYAIGSSGKNFMEGSMRPSGTVPAGGSSIVQLPARIDLVSLLETLQGVRPGSVVPYRADFTLGVDAPVIGRLNLPLSRTGELPVPAVPEVELVSFDIAALSLDAVKATAKLRVKNTNRFQIDLARFGASFVLGGQQIGRASLTNAARIGAGEAANLELPLAFSPNALGAGVYKLLTGSRTDYALTGSIEAATRYGPMRLPFSQAGTTPIRK